MAGKRSPTKRNAEPPRIDNLKLINGIGPEVEKRLNGRGIFTFAQLANIPPTDVAAAVAGLIGLSTEHIIKQDWIGQARTLAAEKTLSEAHEDFEPAAVLLEPTEHLQATTPREEPHNTATEPTSNEVREEFEAPADSEPADKLQAPVEQTPRIELTHAVTPLEEPQKDTETMASKEQFHPATFTVEILLDENNYVHSARVMHVESQREHTWSAWPNTELVDFLSESVELNIHSVEPTLPIAEELVHPEEPDHAPDVVAESKPHILSEAEPMLTGKFHVSEMEIVGAVSRIPLKVLARDTPFDVQLTLDLTELLVPENTPLNYKASVYGKGSRSGLLLGETQGTIIPANTVTIKIEGNTLPEEGIYQLAAQVIVGLPTTKLSIRPGTTALIDGGQIQVF